MSKSSVWLVSFHFNLVDPFHVLNIKDRDVLIVLLVFKIRGAKVSSEEDKQHFIYYTGLLFLFGGVLPRNIGDCCPFLLRHIERVVIFNHSLVMTPIDNNLISISDHIMKSTAIGKCLLCLGTCKLGIDFCQRIIELTSAITLNNKMHYLQKCRYSLQYCTWYVLPLAYREVKTND